MKKLIISLLAIVGIGVLLAGGFYFYMDRPVKNVEEIKEFTVKAGMDKISIVNSLEKEGFIKSKYAGYIYIFLNSNINMQAGTYNINKKDKMSDILEQIGKGDTRMIAKTIRLTFKEGKILEEMAEIVAENFDNISKESFIDTIKEESFIKELIEKYWFLTDEILDKEIRYPLEGYLFPETYDFYLSASPKEIIKLILNHTEKRLAPYKDKIEKSGYSVHDILTIASIVEKEANSSEDRHQVSQVIYKRLDLGMSLGMDATTYYSAGKRMTEDLYDKDLKKKDGYNTRVLDFKGLPVGPICNPSEQSIDAALNPSEGEYVYFYAIQGKDYFFETQTEFSNFIVNARKNGN